jgi:hypothetical protein
MKVFVLIKDETDYNGERTIEGVYLSEAAADAQGKWIMEQARDWCNSMKESDGKDYHWIPNCYTEESETKDF